MTYGWKRYGTHVLTSMIVVVQFAGWYKGSVLIGQLYRPIRALPGKSIYEPREELWLIL